MLDLVLTAVGVLGVAVVAVSGRMERWPMNPPLLALGLGVVLGPEMLGAVEVPTGMEVTVMHTAARLLLAVGLMAVALRYPITDVRQRVPAVALLLLVVLPLMAVTVAAGAYLLLGVPLGLAAVVGAALSPTDPVLASSVVTGGPAEQTMPARLRQVLSIESGANDGLALPFVLVAIALTSHASGLVEFGRGLLQVVIGTLIGTVVGAAAGRARSYAERHHDIEEGARPVFSLVLALAVLGLVGLAHGDAVLGVFVAGLAYNRTVSGSDRRADERIDEGMNELLVLPVFLLLGVVLPWDGWAALGWGGVGLVLVALLVRRLPWVLLLRRPLALGYAEAGWLGWFGPIGVAALFYLGHAHAEGVTDRVVWDAGTLVVAASTLVHGITAAPGRAAYGRSAGR